MKPPVYDHQWKGTRHRLTARLSANSDLRVGSWAEVSQLAVLKLGPTDWLVVPTWYCLSPAFPIADEVYLVQRVSGEIVDSAHGNPTETR
jgi:hypothetical protein